MRIATTLALLLVAAVPLLADHQHVVADDKMDFSTVRTFAIQPGRAKTTRPELNNELALKKVEEAIRTQLLAKKLSESPDHPDVTVGFIVGEDRPNGPSVIFNQGTLLIDITARDSGKLIWQGVYTNENGSPAKVAEKLTSYVQKLLSAFPPKKK